MPALDATLDPWEEISQNDWNGLVIGNGASMAVWARFGYGSLFEEAQRAELDHFLGASDMELFDRLGTTNFEAVLTALQTARMVGEALGTDTQEIEARHSAIRLALISAVRSVHVPWNCVPTTTLEAIRAALLTFQWVYTTNYDLLLYWAIMEGDPYPFPDYFWSQPFDVADTDVARKATRVLFLHGGVHLDHDVFGNTYKRLAGEQNLLDSFGESADGRLTPLFVAEGSADEKLRAIRNSDYLTFAYKSFADHPGDLVVFGSRLGPTDSHLVDAMARWRGKTIAIAMRPGQDDAVVIEAKARLRRSLPEAGLVFFDATTFPLGSNELRVADA